MDFDMSIKQAIDAPGLNSPRYEADGSSQPQIFEMQSVLRAIIQGGRIIDRPALLKAAKRG
jgi:hypothetical protein